MIWLRHASWILLVSCISWGCESRQVQPEDNSSNIAEEASSPSGFASDLKMPLERPTISNQFVNYQTTTEPRPTIDLQAKLPFRTPSNSIRVVGVCSYENGLQCWDETGSRQKSLERDVLRWGERKTGLGFLASVPHYLGRKNRLVILDLQSAEDASKSVWTELFRQQPYVGRASFLIGNQRSGQLGLQNGHWIISVAEPQQSAFGSVLGRFRDSLRASAPVAFLIGERAKIGKYVLELSPTQQFGTSHDWTIRFKIKGNHPEKLKLAAELIDHEGRHIEMADALGKPVTKVERQKLVDEFVRASQSGDDPVERPNHRQAIVSFAIDSTGKVMVGNCNVDPKYVKQMTLSGTLDTTVELTGIPLDPKSKQ